MHEPFSPAHAAAWGLLAGSAVFAAMLVQSGTWWPSAAQYEQGIRILGLFIGTFAAAAFIQNWLVRGGNE
jgi:hypothetical protein